MKMPIEWHERQFEFMRSHHMDLSRARLKAIADWERSSEELELCRRQIDEAKRQGKDGFDAEKFMKKRGQGNDKK